MIARILHRARLSIELHRSLSKRKAARPARREAAQRAHSRQWKRAGQRTRELFS